ncbi:MAG: hypothetical protein Q9172_001997 [Xanthocarpia lactea]
MSEVGNEESELCVWMTGERHYTVTPWPKNPGEAPSTFTKRQLRPHERPWHTPGTPLFDLCSTERLINEKDALLFVAQHTTIPVPRVLDWSVDKDGIASLTTETLNGRVMSDLLAEDDLSDEDKSTLLRNVESYMHNDVFPQLGRLRSKSMGQLAGVLYLPPRINTFPDDSPHCHKARPARNAATERYIFCHNDLNAHNVLIQIDSLEVMCLLDWEYSGYFPPGFEFPYWRYKHEDYVVWDNDPHQSMMASRRALLENEFEEEQDTCASEPLRSAQVLGSILLDQDQGFSSSLCTIQLARNPPMVAEGNLVLTELAFHLGKLASWKSAACIYAPTESILTAGFTKCCIFAAIPDFAMREIKTTEQMVIAERQIANNMVPLVQRDFALQKANKMHKKMERSVHFISSTHATAFQRYQARFYVIADDRYPTWCCYPSSSVSFEDSDDVGLQTARRNKFNLYEYISDTIFKDLRKALAGPESDADEGEDEAGDSMSLT